MKTLAYIITCKTNMHAGKGSVDQGVIDNLVQRDYTERLPCIYGSSLKGALREYFEEYINMEDSSCTEETISKIFGGKDGDKQARKGAQIFHDALLLSIPVRSMKRGFYNATSLKLLKRFVDALAVFGQKDECLSDYCVKANNITQATLYGHGSSDNEVFDIEMVAGDIEKVAENPLSHLFSDGFLLMPNEEFTLLTEDYNLPIIARNQLEKGESKNLFYEQIMPRESKFFFITNDIDESSNFEKYIKKCVPQMPVQIGANASIGYGYCNITQCDLGAKIK